MHKYFTFALLLLLPQLLQAQSDQNKWSFRLNGGYTDQTSSNGVYYLGNNQKSLRDYNVDFSIGRHLSKTWECGVGFYYQRQKDRTVSILFVPEEFFSEQISGTTTEFYIWKFYLAGSWRICNKFYFNPIFSINTGDAYGTMKYLTYKAGDTPLDPYELRLSTNDLVLTDREDFTYDLFSIEATPAFTYYLNNHFALNLQTGIFGLSTIDGKWSNRRFMANVNPNCWRLGLVFSL